MQLLTVGDAAKLLDRSADSVRAYADHGKLKSLRTQNGQRLFELSDVQQLAKELSRHSKSYTARPTCSCGIAGCQGPSGLQAINCIMRQEKNGHDEEGMR